MKFITRVKFRRATAALWTSNNPILFEGEAGYETDTGKFKVGDGVTAWSSLAYSSGEKGDKGDTGEKGDTVVGPAGPNQVTDATETTFANGVLISDGAGNVDLVPFTGDTTKFLRDDGTMAVPPGGGGGYSTDVELKMWTSGECYEITSATVDGYGVIVGGIVKWPDGSAGVYTVTSVNRIFNCADAYTITHTSSGKTVTQGAITRDRFGNAITKPALIVS